MKRPIQYFLSVIVLLSVVLLLQGEASAQIIIQNDSTVDVTPSGFSVIWQATENTVPGITVFADPDGNEEITGQLETIPFPLYGGNPEIIGEYDRDDDMANVRARAKSIGLMRIMVKGCLPETTYYYRISSEGDGETAILPTGSLIAVTTTSENSFIADSKQILVSISDNSGSQDHIGLIVTAFGSDTLYGVSSIVGDGAPSDQAYINLSNLFGPDMRNWAPTGLQQISLEVMIGGGSDIVYLTFDLDFSDNFVVSMEYTIDVNVSGTVDDDTDGDGIPDSWEMANFGDLTTADETTDNDGDGLLDIDEHSNGTDPKDTDTDGDGMPDGYEVANGLNPLVDDANGDLDGDGTSNLQEYLDGTDPTVFNFSITNIT